MNFLKIDIIDYNIFLIDYLELLVETQNCLYYYKTAFRHAKTRERFFLQPCSGGD